MKVSIHNPYLDTLGGGERYTVSFAALMISKGYSVDLEWNDSSIVEKLEKRFGISLKNINIKNDIKRGDGYDVCFWVSDGSIPSLLARNNILHFQFPFKGVSGSSLLNKMKLFRINSIVCNSDFTKKYIDKEYGVNSIVIYPPIDTNSFKPKRKENIILYIGRFSKLTQSKHQDILVKSFKKLVDGGLANWKLILAGGVEVGVGEYLDEIKKESYGYPIDIISSPDFKEIKNLYGAAKIFWSASGFGEDVLENPTKVEHFGMNVVEAMSSGVVPVIYNAGGHIEIIKKQEDGYLWDTTEQLLDITNNLVKNKSLLKRISNSCVLASKEFSKEKFGSAFSLLV